MPPAVYYIYYDSLKPIVKAGEILNCLKEDFELGHGHAMAIYATFKGEKE